MLKWLIFFLLLAAPAWDQVIEFGPMPPEHDLSSPDHWYDYDCCSARDCAPVAMTPENFTVTEQGIYIELPKGAHPLLTDGGTEPTFYEWGNPKIRVSQDEHWHVCVSEATYWETGLHWIYCVYIGGMV